VWWKGGWLYRIELDVVEGWLALQESWVWWNWGWLYRRAQCGERVAGIIG